ncbi:MAG: hypothetical protein ACRC0C_11075 [Gibbsiella quercinecans]|uniref:hypothetical protein n=1 Tax=Gibbsiella quercinecans TaxID=929813 RepID=UPI003A4D4CE2
MTLHDYMRNFVGCTPRVRGMSCGAEELANALKRTSILGVFPAVKVNVDNVEQVLKNQTGIIFAKEIWFWEVL